MKGIISLFKSRKFVLTLIPVITLVLNEMGYAQVSNETLIGLVSAVGVLVASISYEDAGKIVIEKVGEEEE